MSPELLLREFERIGDAPGAIARLRRFVLDLAVSGRVVHQDLSEAPVDLKKGFPSENSRPRKRQPPAQLAYPSASSLVLPPGWMAATVGQVAECLDHVREPVNVETRNSRNAGKSQADLFPYFGATQQQGWIDDFLFDENLVLLGEDGVPFLDPLRPKAYRITGKTWVNNHAHVLRPVLALPEFLVMALNTFDYRGRVMGATRSKLNQGQMRTMPIFLPPLPEQHRIAAKVYELMAICDQWEATQKERELHRDALRSVSLHRLTAEDGSEPADVRFFLGKPRRLITKPEHVAAVRETILDLAVRGRLVPQDPADEHVSPSAEALPTGGPYPLPPSWQWRPVAQVGTARLGKMLDKAKNRGTPRRYLRNVNVRWFGFDLSDVKTMPFEDSELHKFELTAGDILVCEGGEPGRAAVWDGSAESMYFQKALHRVRVFHWMNAHFVVMVLRASASDGRLVAQSTGATFLHLTGQVLARVLVPVPPLAEQHRIVAKVDELMLLCDEIETALGSAQKVRGQLLESLLCEALAGSGDRAFVGDFAGAL